MKYFTFGNVYAGLTVLFTLYLGYLKLYTDFYITWWWVMAPIWISLIGGLFFIGLCYLIVYYWGNDKNINGGNEETKNKI